MLEQGSRCASTTAPRSRQSHPALADRLQAHADVERLLPALAQPHVDVVTDCIAAVRTNGIVTADGRVREVDAIVVATGFHVTDSPTNERIIGRGGDSLADTWRRAGAQAYKGSTVHVFPNLFVMTGPGRGLVTRRPSS